MKNTFRLAIGLALFSMGLNSTSAAEETNKTGAAVRRIGVYDSRAVAVAFVGTKQHNETMRRLTAERDKAKADGNQRRVEELEEQGRLWQELRHKQGFSTAPVDDILEQIKDKVELVKSNAQVSVLVSKWDKAGLARYSKAKQVDITGQLVDALNPNARQRKSAMEIQKVKPIPLDELEKLIKNHQI